MSNDCVQSKALRDAILYMDVEKMNDAIRRGCSVHYIPHNTLLFTALLQIPFLEGAKVLFDNGARVLRHKMNLPLLIDVIDFYKSCHNPSHLPLACRRGIIIEFLDYIIENLSDDEFNVRDDIGNTPYMLAVKGKLPESIISKIYERTIRLNPSKDPRENKNIFGRTIANYEKLTQATTRHTRGGKRRKHRRIRNNRKTKSNIKC